MPRSRAAWPTCCRSSETTLTSLTPRVTGGSNRRSTTSSSSSAERLSDVLGRFFEDCVVVAPEQLGPGVDQGNLVGAVAVADVEDFQLQAEPISPTARDPYLFVSCHPCDVVILDPGQVPDQPGNGVGLAIGPEGQRLGGNAVEDVVHLIPDPAKSIPEQLTWSQFISPLKSRGPPP